EGESELEALSREFASLRKLSTRIAKEEPKLAPDIFESKELPPKKTKRKK
nr:hypothetical protein [Chlamydiota bacterium]